MHKGRFGVVLDYLPEILPCDTKFLAYDPLRYAISGSGFGALLGGSMVASSREDAA